MVLQHFFTCTYNTLLVSLLCGIQGLLCSTGMAQEQNRHRIKSAHTHLESSALDCSKVFMGCIKHYRCFYEQKNWRSLASSPGPSQILSHSRGEKSEKAWYQNYITNRKWWTRSVRNMNSVCTNRVHHFRSVT